MAETIAKKMSMKRKIVIVTVVLIMAAVAGWLTSRYYFRNEKPLVEDSERQGRQDFTMPTSADIKVPVTIFHPGDAGLIKEEKTLAGNTLPVKLAESVLQEYFAGFKSGLKNTVVRSVYEDRNKILYVDLSDEFRRNFQGDARHEYYLLKSFYQTLAANIPGISDVKLLVEGREIDSVGGHMLSLLPLRESVWY
ncbi:MAG TPA: GerMN domain-containing protein [Dissulfurispiraceae bacterium]|nr:GerMN domain-containing protein [Dissulfurispiraceae bacterium]